MRGVYERLGHQVELIERKGERQCHADWFLARRYDVRMSQATSEGEGDFLLTEEYLLAGSGFRTAEAAHVEAQQFFARPVVGLQLIDEKFYHLDTALCVLDGVTIAYYPPAFSPESRRVLARLFPDAIIATDHDAHELGLNAWSDGRHVVLHSTAEDLAGKLTACDFEPIGIDLPEIQKGGGPKCCTMGLYEQAAAPNR